MKTAYMLGDVLQEAMYTAWAVWYNRNQAVFDGKITLCEVVQERVLRGLDEFCKVEEQKRTKATVVGRVSSQIWKTLATAEVKVNVDASLSDQMVRVGVVFRNCEGYVVAAGAKQWRAKWSLIIAEAKAAWYGLSLACRLGFSKVVLESDCSNLFTKLKHEVASRNELGVVISEIPSLKFSFSSLVWSHVRRDGNSVAHHVAIKFSMVFSGKCGWGLVHPRLHHMSLWTNYQYNR